MSPSLDDFYAEMKPFLMGEHTLPQTREVLGASPSGDDDFSFYRVLAERNLFKILSDLYAPLRALVLREDPEAWGPLVREYARVHPPGGHHPNSFGEAFSDHLAQRRERDPSQAVIYEEIADFCWIRQYVYSALDEADQSDGFEQRLFVRHYTHRVHEIVAALEQDAQAPLPEPQPILLLVYRHTRSLQTRLFSPSAAGLVALAKRQHMEVPEALRSIPSEHVATADAQLVEHGVLKPPCPCP